MPSDTHAFAMQAVENKFDRRMNLTVNESLEYPSQIDIFAHIVILINMFHFK